MFLESRPTSPLVSMVSDPNVWIAAKCLNRRGSSKVMTGAAATELSIVLMTLSSASLGSKLVEAIAMLSPTYQSTAVSRVIVVSPASAVVFMTVHVGVLSTPCISRVPCLTPSTLLP